MTMPYGAIPGLDRPVSRIVLGLGEATTADQAFADALLDAFVAAGGTAVDTAAMYRDGESERALGDWLRRRPEQRDLLVLTKGAYWRAGSPSRLTPAAIAADLEGSLRRLGRDRVAGYLLHLDDPAQPPEPLVDALNAQRLRGRVAVVGASNWTTARLDRANAYASGRGLDPFAVSSLQLSLAVPREPMFPRTRSAAGDAPTLDWHRRTATPLLAWSTQANGYFATPAGEAAPVDPDVARVYDSAANRERRRRTAQLAAELGCTPTQLALAWVLNQPDLTLFAAVGPRRLEELRESLAATGIALSAARRDWLDLAAAPMPA